MFRIHNNYIILSFLSKGIPLRNSRWQKTEKPRKLVDWTRGLLQSVIYDKEMSIQRSLFSFPSSLLTYLNGEQGLMPDGIKAINPC